VVSCDLKLTGTLKDPIALGNVKIDSGRVQFPFSNLEVTQGFVTLSSENPYEPQLLLSAASRRAGFDVKMEVSGQATHPLVQFSSTPPLGSEQIVLMLTAGQLPRSEFTLSTQQKAQNLAMYLGKNLMSQFGLGQDSDRLSIQTGENISETGALTYRVEFKLSDRWYLVGEYDRFNALNAGLKWRIYSK
jgi:translocation and assembly module TamB